MLWYQLEISPNRNSGSILQWEKARGLPCASMLGLHSSTILGFKRNARVHNDPISQWEWSYSWFKNNVRDRTRDFTTVLKCQ